jgi:transcriptional regulator with XRE-family HTH domain
MPALPKLRQYRERAALTQDELAKKAGTTRSTIMRLENGADSPYPATIRKLAAALNVEPQDLMGPMGKR